MKLSLLGTRYIYLVISSSVICDVASFSTPNPNNPFFRFSTNYLNALSTQPASPDDQLQQQQTPVKVAASTAPSTHRNAYSNNSHLDNLQKVAEETPDDHYAKNHPGAGWAGYKNPMFGGYLDNLNENSFDEGKKADYGDDVRWGAQVYLDQLDGGNTGNYQ